MAGVSEATVQRRGPRFVVRAFSTELGEGLGMGAIQVIAMDQSVMVWVGENAGGDLPPMGPLVFALTTRFESMPLATTLIEHGDGVGSGVAQRLAKVRRKHAARALRYPRGLTRYPLETAHGTRVLRELVSPRRAVRRVRARRRAAHFPRARGNRPGEGRRAARL